MFSLKTPFSKKERKFFYLEFSNPIYLKLQIKYQPPAFEFGFDANFSSNCFLQLYSTQISKHHPTK
jgi:hypothetical protein